MAKKRVKKSVKAVSPPELSVADPVGDICLEILQKLWPDTPARRENTVSPPVELDLLAQFFRLPKEKGQRVSWEYFPHWTPLEVPRSFSPLFSGPPLYMMGTALQPYRVSATMEYLRMHGFREEPPYALDWQGDFSLGGLTDE